jgi:O-antigen/teichoic acid export membrane protein
VWQAGVLERADDGSVRTRASLRSDVAASVASQAAQLVAGLVAGIATARGLGPDHRGLLALATTIPQVLVVLAGLGAPVAAAYLMAHGDARLRELSRAGSLLALAGTGVTLLALAVLTASGADHVWFVDLPRSLLLLGCVLVPPSLLLATLVALLRGSGRIAAASGVEATQGVLAAALTVAVMVAGRGPAAVVWSQLLAVGVALAVAWALLRVDGVSLRPSAERSLLGRMLGFGLRADLGNAMHLVGFRLDLFLVNVFVGTAALGVYAVAAKLAELLLVLPYAVALVVMPRGVLGRRAGAGDETCVLFSWTLVVSTATALGMAAVGAPLVRLLFSDQFADAYLPLLLLLPGVVAFGATNVLMNDVVGRGRPGAVSVVAVVGLVASVVLDLWLVPAHGVAGAAVASTLVYLVDSALAVVLYLRVSGRRVGALWVLRSGAGAPSPVAVGAGGAA